MTKGYTQIFGLDYGDPFSSCIDDLYLLIHSHGYSSKLASFLAR